MCLGMPLSHDKGRSALSWDSRSQASTNSELALEFTWCIMLDHSLSKQFELLLTRNERTWRMGTRHARFHLSHVSCTLWDAHIIGGKTCKFVVLSNRHNKDSRAGAGNRVVTLKVARMNHQHLHDLQKGDRIFWVQVGAGNQCKLTGCKPFFIQSSRWSVFAKTSWRIGSVVWEDFLHTFQSCVECFWASSGTKYTVKQDPKAVIEFPLSIWSLVWR